MFFAVATCTVVLLFCDDFSSDTLGIANRWARDDASKALQRWVKKVISWLNESTLPRSIVVSHFLEVA